MNKTIFHETFLNIFNTNFLHIVLKITLITFFIFIIFLFSGYWILSNIDFTNYIILNIFLKYAGFIGIIIIMWLLLPTLVPAISGIFEDQIINLIEKDYGFKTISKPSDYNSKIIILETIKYLIFSLIINLILIPLYFIPLINFLIYYFVNSYLIGKITLKFTIARYLGFKKANLIVKKHIKVFLIIGFIVCILANIPIINLLSPLIATCLAAHTFFSLPEYKIN